jgi:pimeloyl-ACP methyl ester carboxylesterase
MMTMIAMAALAFMAAALLALVIFNASTARRVAAALPPEGEFIDIDGARLHYVDRGSGPAIVMLHGLGGQTRNFSYALLARLTPHYRVILLDRPGSGYSTRPAGMPAALATQSAVVAHFIRALELSKPLLVGHSFGGAVALGVALDHADAVSALALIAPLTHPLEDAPASMRALAIRSALKRRVVAWTLAIPLQIRFRKRMLTGVFSPDAPPRDFAMAGGGLLSLRPKAFYATSSDMLAAGDGLPALARRYPQLAVPTRVLFGRQDAVLGWEAHGLALQRAAPGIALEVIDGGHMLPVSAPDETAAWIVAGTGQRNALRA